jgi:NAD(P)H-dependent FMN reductase
MKRLALNGSPRGVKSNSRAVIGWILEGMAAEGAGEIPVIDLARVRDLAAQREAFLSADEILLVFPLYTDSVPGIVKNFLDSLAGAEPARLAGKRFAFVVQSGFPEPVQSEPVAVYLRRVCRRLGFVPAGSAIRGNSEGLRLMPDNMTRRTRELFAALGKSLAAGGRFDQGIVRRLAGPRRLGVLGRLMILSGLGNLYWAFMLKQNKAWKQRFDRPYAGALQG